MRVGVAAQQKNQAGARAHTVLFASFFWEYKHRKREGRSSPVVFYPVQLVAPHIIGYVCLAVQPPRSSCCSEAHAVCRSSNQSSSIPPSYSPLPNTSVENNSTLAHPSHRSLHLINHPPLSVAYACPPWAATCCCSASTMPNSSSHMALCSFAWFQKNRGKSRPHVKTTYTHARAGDAQIRTWGRSSSYFRWNSSALRCRREKAREGAHGDSFIRSFTRPFHMPPPLRRIPRCTAPTLCSCSETAVRERLSYACSLSFTASALSPSAFSNSARSSAALVSATAAY